MICQGMTISKIMLDVDLYDGINTWGRRIGYMKPKNILELGTGQGASGACIMPSLLPDAKFTTINYPDGHIFGEQLDQWNHDKRLSRLYLDTLDPNSLKVVNGPFDLLFLDTTHEAWHAATELRIWQDLLEDGAIVIVDDLNQHDMMDFFDSLPYEKILSGHQGVFRYRTSLRYDKRFNQPDQTTYNGNLSRDDRDRL